MIYKALIISDENTKYRLLHEESVWLYNALLFYTTFYLNYNGQDDLTP